METITSGSSKIKGRLRVNETNSVPILNVEEVLHMEGGVGEASYANNSIVQKTVIKRVRPVLEDALLKLTATMSPECLMVADLGCSSGPNVLEVISIIIDVMSAKRHHTKDAYEQEVKVFLNDLLGNDFNNLFNIIVPNLLKRNNNEKCTDTEYQPKGEILCYVSGTPGSFYGRVFPKNFLHFVHASSSVHYLSQVPKGLVTEDGEALNKGAIYISSSSPPEVYKAYSDQFKSDFTSFLSHRSQEIIPGGRMVLTFRCNTKIDNLDCIWDFELFAIALKSMVDEGLLHANKLDAYNIPFYAPTVEQVKELVEAEGSFTLCKVQTLTVDMCLTENMLTLDLDAQAKLATDRSRAAGGPIFAHGFGPGIMDGLFQRLQNLARERLNTRKLEILHIVVSLARNDY